MTKVYLAIGFFSLAAILGIYLLSFVLRGKETPKRVAFVHGPLAAAGLIFLILASYESGWSEYLGQIALFIAVAMGGVLMIRIDLAGHPVPKWLGLAHGLTAVCSFAWLLSQVF